MKGFKIIPLLLLFALIQVAFSDEVTVTLQNGLDDYTGCEDAWVFGAYYNYSNQRDKNYGTETKKSVFWMNDGSKVREST